MTKAEKITIKKNNETTSTKFKLCTNEFLCTLKVYDTSKVEKIIRSIPPDLKNKKLKVNSKWEAIFRLNCFDYMQTDLMRFSWSMTKIFDLLMLKALEIDKRHVFHFLICYFLTSVNKLLQVTEFDHSYKLVWFINQKYLRISYIFTSSLKVLVIKLPQIKQRNYKLINNLLTESLTHQRHFLRLHYITGK